jgi:hypothetical protein
MTEQDLIVFPVGVILRRNERYSDVQKYTLNLCKAFVAFMDEHGLFSKRPYEGSEPPSDMDIYESHLNAEGKILFRSLAINRWLDRNDDITKPISMRVLERELKKLWG